MVLGIQWLSTLGDIKCSFKDLEMEFVDKGTKMALRGTPKSDMEWMGGRKQDKNIRQNVKQAELSSMQLHVYPSTGMTHMNMEGMEINNQSELNEVVPQFSDVFEVPKELPPRREHDHRIPLIEGTLRVNIRPYRDPPTQKKSY